MRKLAGTICLLLLTSGHALANGGRCDGEMIGKVVAAERLQEAGYPYTAYTVIVFRDSPEAGNVVAIGDSIRVWTPGGKAIAFLETADGPLATIALVVGEKFFALYRLADERRFLTDKWTIWRRTAPRRNATIEERASLAEEDVKLEALLADSTIGASLQDSLELFHTSNNMRILANPEPAPGRTWRDYDLLNRSAGTLSAVRRMAGLERDGDK